MIASCRSAGARIAPIRSTIWSAISGSGRWSCPSITVFSGRGRSTMMTDLKILGVDFLKFHPNWRVGAEAHAGGVQAKGRLCWHCHAGCFTYPMQIAVKFKIPLVIWGEPTAEYTSYYSYEYKEEVDERRFNRFVDLGITAQDMLGNAGWDSHDAGPRTVSISEYSGASSDQLPVGLPGELHAVGCQKACGDHGTGNCIGRRMMWKACQGVSL